MSAVATLSKKFQISIPKAMQDANGWEAGQEFVLLPKDGGVLLVPVPEIGNLVGIVSGADTTDYRDRREDRY